MKNLNSEIKSIVILLIFQSLLFSHIHNITGKVIGSDSLSIHDAMIIFSLQNSDISDTVVSNENGEYNITLNTDVEIETEEKTPDSFQLYQNYPNPFNPGTWIKFHIPETQKVKIDIYNLLGQKVKNLSNKTYQPGEAKIYWNGTNNQGSLVSAGIYLYVMETKNGITSKKMLLLDGGSTPNFQPSFQQSNSAGKLSKTLTNDIYSLRVIKEGFHNYFEDSLIFNSDEYEKDLVLYSLDSLDIFVAETDVLIGAQSKIVQIDNFRNTHIFNNNTDSLEFNVLVQVPDSLQVTNSISPKFGKNALLNLKYGKYWNYPDINNSYIVNNPIITNGCFNWNNLKLGSSDLYKIAWHNYFADSELDCFKILNGNHQYLGLNINSKYDIDVNQENTEFLDLIMEIEMQNISNDTIFDLFVNWHIPRVIYDISNTEYYNLYELIDDELIFDPEDNVYYNGKEWSRKDGYLSLTRGGQEFEISCDTLTMNEVKKIKYKFMINPLLNKFEIHPLRIIVFKQKSNKRLWEETKIYIPSKKVEYNNNIHYMKGINFSIPSYQVFKIDNGKYNIFNSQESDTTYYYPYPYN
ncbi:MAG: T9SS type A sorting domain-containing protein [Candidatus Marinimicrobia bacterium]|nr:T9SS type A sorting domain-containing protein [Candidatus Neomarinimicrobiota bacterium]